MRVDPIPQTTPDSGPPKTAGDYARQFGFGLFKDADSAMGHRVSYNYERGSVLYQHGEFQGLQADTADGPVNISAETAGLARKAGLTNFKDADAAMGGRKSYNFENGFISYQNDKLDRLHVNDQDVDPTELP